ncbi:MAG: efflux RND transporter periplasmic adaptor subunit [Kiritimatiellae bacterium]|nr:efflux RND transporter periplasmic adaptor subunit [Kiritimatiellia bacterium]MDD5520188.1 efflux RND transporter periplasmic adaptor subunit [Kiritimatiellia bacterium]
MHKRLQMMISMLTVLLMIAAGCGKKAEDSVMGEGKGEEKSEGVVGSMTPEQVMAAKCSHGLTYQCAECRYEVGVVKVDKSIMKNDPDSKTGLVQTVQTGKKKVSTVINISGEVRLNENTVVHIGPRISGIVRSMNVDIGSKVKKGDVLFTIDSVELGQALSDYQKNLVMAEIITRNFRREKSLFDQKIGSEMEMGEAQVKLQESQANLKAAEQKLHVMGMTDGEISSIRTVKDKTPLRGSLSIRAPISGNIIERHGTAGEMVEPGRDVMVLADLNTVWVWGAIYERDLAVVLKHVSAGTVPVEISVPAFTGKTFPGKVDYVGAIMDESTRTIKIRMLLDNKEGLLRPGMFCEGKLLLKSNEEVFAIPSVALLSDEGVDFVFKHMKDDYYLRKNVRKGREFAGDVEIIKGIEPGQVIVAEGSFLLKSDVLRSKMGAGCAD